MRSHCYQGTELTYMWGKRRKLARKQSKPVRIHSNITLLSGYWHTWILLLAIHNLKSIWSVKIDPLEIWTTIEDALRDVLRASPMEYKFEDDPFLIFQRILSHSKIFFNEDHNTKEKKHFYFLFNPNLIQSLLLMLRVQVHRFAIPTGQRAIHQTH